MGPNDDLAERIAQELERAGPDGLTGDEIVQRMGVDPVAVYLRLGWLCGERPARARVPAGYDPGVHVGLQRFVSTREGKL